MFPCHTKRRGAGPHSRRDYAEDGLSDEFQLVNLEMRVGKTRIEALHELGRRTGLGDAEFPWRASVPAFDGVRTRRR